MAPALGVVLSLATSSTLSDSIWEDEEMTKGQKRFVFALLVMQLFTGQLTYALFSPFFPDEAYAKDVNGTVQGSIFGSFQLVLLIFTPLAMKLVPILGPRNLLNATNFLVGGASVGFGFVWYIGEGMLFTIACFASRIVSGIGVSVAMVVGYGMLPFLFGDNLSTGSSILETAITLAFIIAPMLGGTLYTAAGGSDTGLGYVVPFVVLGATQVLLGFCTLAFFPAIPTPAGSDSRIKYFSPRVLVPCILCMVGAGAIEYMSPTLEPMMEAGPFDFTVLGVSGVFGVCSGVYVVVGPLVAVVDDYFEGRFALPIMGFGMIGLGVGYIFLGPALFAQALGLQLSRPNMWVGIVVIGTSTAFVLIPTYNNMHKWARHADADDRANATSVLYNLFYAAGAWLGPTIGGCIGDTVGIPESYTLLGAFSFVSGILVVGFYIFVRKSENDSTRDSLLTDSMWDTEEAITKAADFKEGPRDSLASDVSTAVGSSTVAHGVSSSTVAHGVSETVQGNCEE